MANDLLVGLVDSGHASEQASLIHAGQRFWLEDEQLRQGPLHTDSLGHGATMISHLMAEAGTARLCLAQVFGRRGQTSAIQVAAAIHWLIGQDVALISLSLGLRQDRPVLRQACAAAHEAGIVLCASSPAQGEVVFPAAYPGVLRITGDARCAAGQWSWLDSAQAEFGASVRAGNGMAGASVACAALAGHIVGFLQREPGAGRQAVIDHLRQGASFVGPERRRVAP
ncbi:subtilisin-like serine protease QhpE [Pseudomonas vanderleydeniana]|uniref:Peptidase S8 and S53 subtilisin kexin sedolisin n=1 Tax=Pseudomonas vanderleydeniana TaxID=2745495 RepID=A0A9E6PJX9_9PSED|nr:S8 family serine peptidase [Pseudomonas vanderleydeniana]QXI27858.1 peptidase S8 and S53 subtilisin kexin sedolisin [Pseudomonas vanderleydeniana]